MSPIREDTFSLQTPDQLGTYLRSLRKSRGLTQGDVGAKLGVSAARISAMELNPGVMGVAQLMRLLHGLGARLVVRTAVNDRTTPAARARTVPRGEW